VKDAVNLNRETMNRTVEIDEGLCLGCGICADICPRRILYVDEKANVARVTDGSKCDRLRGCERACPVGAIKIN